MSYHHFDVGDCDCINAPPPTPIRARDMDAIKVSVSFAFVHPTKKEYNPSNTIAKVT